MIIRRSSGSIGLPILLMGVWMILVFAFPAGAAPGGQDTMPSASRLFAGRLAHMARQLVQSDQLDPDALEGALILAETAGELDTGNVEYQRLVREAAALLERDSIVERATRRIIELDPADTVAQLARLNSALNKYQDVESRAAAYEQLLRPANRSRLPGPIASRLATDLALIRQREGDSAQFARWLTEAMTLDPANPVAASIAVEFFDESAAKDPVGRAELLINLVMTNPADHLAQVALARLLLEEGSYAASARMYDLAAASRTAAGLPAWLELEVDRAIAYWGSGAPEAALRRIERVEQMLADAAALEAAEDATPAATDAAQDAAEIATHPSLLAVKSALVTRADSAENAGTIRQAVVRGYEEHLSAPTDDEFSEASRLLEAAWIAVWLLEDAEQTRVWLDRVRSVQPLTETAQTRFTGWLALREGDIDSAAATLSQLSEHDDAAKLGMAVALESQGNPREAARALLDVARRRSGTLMGVWAADRLTAILNQRVPLTAAASRLDGLIAAIPTSFDRYPEDPRMVLAMSIRPLKRVYAPFEPIVMEIALTNRSSRAMAIGPEGPIRPHLLLQPSVTTVSGERLGRAREVIVDLARRLQLGPRETMTIQVELRRNCLDLLVGERPLQGALIQVEAVANFIALPDGRIAPGMLGLRAMSEGFRLRGVTVDETWFTTALTLSRDARSINDVQMAVLLAYAAMLDAAPSGMSMDDIARRLAEGWTNMSAPDQAWVLSVLPADPQLERIRAAARPIDHPLVRTAYLVFQVEDPSDPMLDAAVRSEGPRLKRLAEIIRTLSGPRDESAGESAADPDDGIDGV